MAKKKPVQLGRWKQTTKRRRTFFRRALASTDASIKEIAARSGVSRGTAYSFNKKFKIRSKKEVAHLAAKARQKVRATRREKILSFSFEEKQVLLAQHKPALISVVKKWWSSKSIKKEFGEFKDFYQEMSNYVFEQLDYYNPKYLIEGKPRSVLSWMMDGAKIFCKRSYKYASEKREKEMPRDKKDRFYSEVEIVT